MDKFESYTTPVGKKKDKKEKAFESYKEPLDWKHDDSVKKKNKKESSVRKKKDKNRNDDLESYTTPLNGEHDDSIKKKNKEKNTDKNKNESPSKKKTGNGTYTETLLNEPATPKHAYVNTLTDDKTGNIVDFVDDNSYKAILELKTLLASTIEEKFARDGYKRGGAIKNEYDLDWSTNDIPDKLSGMKRIGGGHFGDVYVGNGVVIKVLKHGEDFDQLPNEAKKKTEDKLQKELKLEMAALQVVENANVVKFLGYDDQDKDGLLRLTTELLPIVHHLGEDDFALNVKAIAVCAASGLLAIHQAGLLHNDVAARNIFITSESTAKVGDFGLAGAYDEQGWYSLRSGAAYPRDVHPPENDFIQHPTDSEKRKKRTLKYRKHFLSLKADVYAFGLFLCELCFNVENLAWKAIKEFGFTSFCGAKLDPPKLIFQLMIASGNIRFRRDKYGPYQASTDKEDTLTVEFTSASTGVGLAPDLPDALLYIILKCLDPNPQERPLMTEVRQNLLDLSDI